MNGRDNMFNKYMIETFENEDPSSWGRLPQKVINIPAYDDYTYFGEVTSSGNLTWPIGWGILRHKDNGLQIACEFIGPRKTPHKHVIFAFPNGLRFTAETFFDFQILKIKNILKNGNSPLEMDKIQPFLLKEKTKLDETLLRAINGTDGTYTLGDLKFPAGIAPAAGGRRKRNRRSRRGRSKKHRSRRSRRF